MNGKVKNGKQQSKKTTTTTTILAKTEEKKMKLFHQLLDAVKTFHKQHLFTNESLHSRAIQTQKFLHSQNAHQNISLYFDSNEIRLRSLYCNRI